MKILILLVISILSLLNTQASNKDSIYIRVNQMGYQPADSKKAIVFSNAVLKEKIDIVDDKTGHRIETIKAKPLKA